MADDPFDYKPGSAEESAALDEARAARAGRHREQRRAEGAVRRSNRAVGALVLAAGAGLVAATFVLHDPQRWDSPIGPTTAMAMRVGGLMLGLQGLRMPVFGTKE